MTDSAQPEPLASSEGTEHVGLAFRALGAGITLGLALQSLVTFGVRTLVGQAPTERPLFASPPVMLLLGGTFLGLVLSGVATARLLAPIRNLWRQTMFGIVAAFASFALSLITIPIYQTLGRSGLLAFAAGCALLALWIGRSPRRVKARS
jgi:hypothetical protein